eukprot:Colp12_sorted_trinity150504_noHs@34105
MSQSRGTAKPNGAPQTDNKKPGTPAKSSSSSMPEFLCKIKYRNTLPDIPFGPKHLSYPFNPMRFVQYQPTTLEKKHKHPLLTEQNLGVPIDLVDPDAYIVGDGLVKLDPKDEALLDDRSDTEDSKRAQHAQVSWLRRTEYIGTDFMTATPSQDTDKHASRDTSAENWPRTTEEQVRVIEETFAAANRLPTHPHNPSLTAVEVMPVLPDFDLWGWEYAQVQFDGDPYYKASDPTAGRENADPQEVNDALAHGLLRGMQNPDNPSEQFVAYFLPTEESMRKRKRVLEEGGSSEDRIPKEYESAREYSWTVNIGTAEERQYIFRMGESGNVTYDEVNIKVKLKRRRQMNADRERTITRLTREGRPFAVHERQQQRQRLAELQGLNTEDLPDNDEGGEDEGKGGANPQLSSDSDDDLPPARRKSPLSDDD